MEEAENAVEEVEAIDDVKPGDIITGPEGRSCPFGTQHAALGTQPSQWIAFRNRDDHPCQLQADEIKALGPSPVSLKGDDIINLSMLPLRGGSIFLQKISLFLRVVLIIHNS